MWSKLSTHFSDTRSRMSPERAQNDKFLIGSVPFPRWLLVPASIGIQIAAGSFYAWSVYNGPITDRMNEGYAEERVSKELIAETFYAAVFAFGVACALCGPWLERYGPRRMTLVGAVFFFVGQMLSALAMFIQSVPLLFVGFGAIGGFGIGCCYIIPVAVLQQWYPEHKGLSAGIAVGAFGLGSVLASFTQSAFLESRGPMWTFIILGSVYFVVQFISALIIRRPPSAPRPTGEESKPMAVNMVSASSVAFTTVPYPNSNQQGPLRSAAHSLRRLSTISTTSAHVGNPHNFMSDLKSADYKYIYAIFFLSVIPGLVVISRVADMVQSAFLQPVATSTWVVGLNGAFNVIGRFAMGMLSDRIPRLGLLVASILLTTVTLVTMVFSLSEDIFVLFITSMWLLTALYGGACAIIPGILGDVFGSAHIGALYGLLMTAWASGGVIGGVGFTAVINAQRSAGVPANRIYDITIYAMIPLSVLGAVLTLMLTLRRRRLGSNALPVPSGGH